MLWRRVKGYNEYLSQVYQIFVEAGRVLTKIELTVDVIWSKIEKQGFPSITLPVSNSISTFTLYDNLNR